MARGWGGTQGRRGQRDRRNREGRSGGGRRGARGWEDEGGWDILGSNESIFDRNLDSFFYKNSSTNILLFNSSLRSLLCDLWFFSPQQSLVLLSAISGSSLRNNLWFFSPQQLWFFSPQPGSSLRSNSGSSLRSNLWFFSPQQSLVLLSATISGRKCVPHYDELCVIFGDDQATGGNAITGNEANIELPSLEEMCNADKSLPTKEEKDEINHSSSSGTRTGSNGQRTKRKKSSNIDANEQRLTTAANRLADAFAHTDCARLQKELRNIPELSLEDVSFNQNQELTEFSYYVSKTQVMATDKEDEHLAIENASGSIGYSAEGPYFLAIFDYP
ncbi:hypothetical protein Syun_001096 [Stephania yunnanensis]|uniref:Uncharacterized protein n=1 Tax=Stephania yunnanensis TaxID=152371 RepID=A0AAP0QAJ4_9MAGN